MAVLRAGMRTLRGNVRLVPFLYLTKLGLAAVICLPLLVMINATLENARFATQLLSNWSLDVIGELIRVEENVLPMFLIGLFFYSVLALVIKQFLNGGIYGSFHEDRPVTASEFGALGGKFFADNLRITLFMAAVYVVALIIGGGVVSFVVGDWFRGFGPVALYSAFLRFALLYPFFIAASILSDVMRFRLVAKPEESFGARLKASLDIFKERFVQLNGIYYLYFLPFVGIWLLIELLAVQVTGWLGSMFGVLLEMLLFQFCSFLRTGQSLAALATIARAVERGIGLDGQEAPAVPDEVDTEGER